MRVGHHLSITMGFPKMIEKTKEIGMNTFSCMIGNPQTGNFKERPIDEIYNLNQSVHNGTISNLIVHCPYTFNLASANENVRTRTISDMKKVRNYMDNFTRPLYVLHPGSYVRGGREVGLKRIIDGLNEILEPNQQMIICLETMAGKGTELGRSFEELAQIINGSKYPEKLGICFDTCHTWDAGYDLADFEDIKLKLKKLGLYEKIEIIHLNDSKNKLGSRKDRHESVGNGMIGSNILSKYINNKDWIDLPFILESPILGNFEEMKKEITYVKSLNNY